MRIAILIAYKEDSPFKEIRAFRKDLDYFNSDSFRFECFFIKGNSSSRLTKLFSDLIEKKRFTKLGLFLRIPDSFLLSKFRFYTPKYSLNGRDLNVNIPDELRFLGPKMLSAYKFCLDQDFDFVFKTTISSVVNFPKLKEFVVKSCFTSFLYAGRVINPTYKPFVSGSCLLLNRAAVAKIWEHRKLLDHSVLDDVSIGKLMRRIGIEVSELSSIDVCNLEEVDRLNGLDLHSVIHLRCKSEKQPREDVQILEAVLSKLKTC